MFIILNNYEQSTNGKLFLDFFFPNKIKRHQMNNHIKYLEYYYLSEEIHRDCIDFELQSS